MDKMMDHFLNFCAHNRVDAGQILLDAGLEHYYPELYQDDPDIWKKSIAKRYIQQMLNKAFSKELIEIYDALSAEGIRFIVLKGLFLSMDLFDRPNLRPSSDIDILIGEEDLKQTCALFGRLGFTTADSRPAYAEMTENYWRFSYGRHHIEPLYKDVDAGSPVKVMVEIHIKPFEHLVTDYGYSREDLIRNEDLFRTARTYYYLDRPFLRLAREEELLFLLIHHASHLFSSCRDMLRSDIPYETALKTLYDTALYWERFSTEIDIGRVEKLSEDWNRSIWVRLSAQLLRDVFGCALPFDDAIWNAKLSSEDSPMFDPFRRSINQIIVLPSSAWFDGTMKQQIRRIILGRIGEVKIAVCEGESVVIPIETVFGLYTCQPSDLKASVRRVGEHLFISIKGISLQKVKKDLGIGQFADCSGFYIYLYDRREDDTTSDLFIGKTLFAPIDESYKDKKDPRTEVFYDARDGSLDIKIDISASVFCQTQNADWSIGLNIQISNPMAFYNADKTDRGPSYIFAIH